MTHGLQTHPHPHREPLQPLIVQAFRNLAVLLAVMLVIGIALAALYRSPGK